MGKNLIGKNIFNLRQFAKLNQKQFGEKIGYSQRTISDWENVNTEPSIAAIKIICNTFDITYSELLDD